MNQNLQQKLTKLTKPLSAIFFVAFVSFCKNIFICAPLRHLRIVLFVLFVSFCGISSAQFTRVGAEWEFKRIADTMVVTASYNADTIANYYLLRSADLSSWSTAVCAAVTNTGARNFVLTCPVDVAPYAFLRLVRGPYTPGCLCP